MQEEFDINQNLIDYFQNIKQSLESNRKDIVKSIDIKNAIKTKNKTLIINYIIFLYAKNSEKALSKLKQEKVFFLDINSKNRIIIEIIEFLLKNSKKLELTEKDIIYFESKKNLSLISEDIYTVLQQIKKEIKNYGDSFIRDILFVVDMHFYKISKGIKSIDIAIETLSEICSFLIYLFSQINKEHKISQHTFSSKNSLNERNLNNLILLSFKIRNFQDIEKFVDYFNYKCIKEKNNLIIKGYDELIEKSRIYGNFHSNMQRQALVLDTIDVYGDDNCFYKLIDKISKSFEIFFELKKVPIPRYIFKFPLDDKIKEFILKEEYFLEEIFELKEIKKEYIISDIMNFKISNLLTLRDLIIIKRLFMITGLLNSDFFFNILEKDRAQKQVIYNSWIKTFTHEDIYNLLLPFIGDDKAKEFISEFSWKLEANKKLDLQYTPLINLDDYYFPLNIFINSNLFRNSLFRNSIRPHKVMNKDSISLAIMNVLRKNFKKVAVEIKFNKNELIGDFDVIAYIDNVIYIFECKNTITPTDLHELRTTYKDNLLHGFEQLSKCKKVLSINDYIKDLNSNLKWEITDNFKIVTCLVLGTRMFNGYTDGEHHVRSFHELFNFLDTGKIIIRNKDVEKEINLWKDNTISGYDIYNFIQNRILHNLVFDSCYSKTNKIFFKNKSVSFETFEFNLNDFNINLNTNFM